MRKLMLSIMALTTVLTLSYADDCSQYEKLAIHYGTREERNERWRCFQKQPLRLFESPEAIKDTARDATLKENVDEVRAFVYYLGGVGGAQLSVEMQNAIVDALIQIVRHARPKSETHVHGEEARTYFGPTVLALDQLSEAYRRNSPITDATTQERKAILQKIANALKATAAQDKSSEIARRAFQTLEGLGLQEELKAAVQERQRSGLRVPPCSFNCIVVTCG